MGLREVSTDSEDVRQCANNLQEMKTCGKSDFHLFILQYIESSEPSDIYVAGNKTTQSRFLRQIFEFWYFPRMLGADTISPDRLIGVSRPTWHSDYHQNIGSGIVWEIGKLRHPVAYISDISDMGDCRLMMYVRTGYFILRTTSMAKFQGDIFYDR